MPRSKDQAARRKLLLDAAVRVINDQGPARMQMKDIADMAGMATGSVYYYSDRADAVAELSDARDKLRTMVDMGLPRPQDEPLSLALYQVMVAKARDSDHASMITDLCGEQRRLYQQILDEGTAAGQFRPLLPTASIAQNLISLEDGYGLGLATGNHDYDFAQARLLVLAAAAHWTQCQELLDGDQRLGTSG
jgi:AcrR family transcriptional regulator